MEIIPHFWVSDSIKKKEFLNSKKIKAIIILSKHQSFYKHIDIEQIRIPCELTNNNKNDNIVIYQHLYDVTQFIFEKIINNKNVLLIGNEKDESILYIFILAYYIRYGKLDIKNSLNFLDSKIKINYFNYNDALFKFYKDINSNK